MKPPALRALTITGAAGGLLWAWYLMRMGPGHARALPPTPPGRLPLSKTGGPPVAGDAGKDAALPALDPSILARMEQWLEKRQFWRALRRSMAPERDRKSGRGKLTICRPKGKPSPIYQYAAVSLRP
jgi:hypothetical protein